MHCLDKMKRGLLNRLGKTLILGWRATCDRLAKCIVCYAAMHSPTFPFMLDQLVCCFAYVGGGGAHRASLSEEWGEDEARIHGHDLHFCACKEKHLKGHSSRVQLASAQGRAGIA